MTLHVLFRHNGGKKNKFSIRDVPTPFLTKPRLLFSNLRISFTPSQFSVQSITFKRKMWHDTFSRKKKKRKKENISSIFRISPFYLFPQIPQRDVFHFRPLRISLLIQQLNTPARQLCFLTFTRLASARFVVRPRCWNCNNCSRLKGGSRENSTLEFPRWPSDWIARSTCWDDR